MVVVCEEFSRHGVISVARMRSCLSPRWLLLTKPIPASSRLLLALEGLVKHEKCVNVVFSVVW